MFDFILLSTLTLGLVLPSTLILISLCRLRYLQRKSEEEIIAEVNAKIDDLIDKIPIPSPEKKAVRGICDRIISAPSFRRAAIKKDLDGMKDAVVNLTENIFTPDESSYLKTSLDNLLHPEKNNEQDKVYPGGYFDVN